MRQTLKEIKKIKKNHVIENAKYDFKVSYSEDETEKFKKCKTIDDVLVILELNNGN